MQKSRVAALVGGVVLALALGAGPAPAAVLTIVDSHTPGVAPCLSASAPAACNGGGASVGGAAWSHDVSADLAPGDTITGAQLELVLWDDQGRGDGAEKLSFAVDGLSLAYNADANHDALLVLGDLTVLGDGVLDAVLGALSGDFFLGGSTLTVWVDRPDPPEGKTPDAAVPLPGTLVLLGAGLLAAQRVLRRRA
jgi:hypothetical protein